MRPRPARDSEAPDETDLAIVKALLEAKDLLTNENAKVIEPTPRVTRPRFARLDASGFVREVGARPQDSKRRYYRTEG